MSDRYIIRYSLSLPGNSPTLLVCCLHPTHALTTSKLIWPVQIPTKSFALHYTSTIAQLFEVSPGLRGQWQTQTPHISLNGTTHSTNGIPCLNYVCWLDRSGKIASTSCGTMHGPSLSLLESPSDTPMRESRLVPNPFASHKSRPHYRRPGHPFINDDVFQCGSRRDGLAVYKLVKH